MPSAKCERANSGERDARLQPAAGSLPSRSPNSIPLSTPSSAFPQPNLRLLLSQSEPTSNKKKKPRSGLTKARGEPRQSDRECAAAK